MESFDPQAWPAAAGAMAKRIRAIDWSATSLGAINGWPQCLKTTVDIVLRSPAPMLLIWGANEFVFANDGCVALLGATGLAPGTNKDPSLDGILDAGLVQEALAGNAHMSYERAVTLQRAGVAAHLRLNIAYSPVLDERGSLAGALAILSDRSEQVQSPQPASKRPDVHQSEALYRALAANLPGGAAFVIDRDLRYLLAAGQALAPTGMTPAMLEGKTLHEALEPGLVRIYEADYRQALGGEPFHREHTSHGRDYITHGVPLANGSGEIYAVLAVSYEITERKRREANMAFLNEASQDLARWMSIDETMEGLGARIAAHLGLSACAFAELNETAEIAVINYGWHRSDVPSLLGTYRMEEFVTPEILQLCRAGKAVIIRDVFDDPKTDGDQYAALNIGSFVSIPLVRAGEWRFLLVVYRTEPYDWRDDEIELTRELANQIWTRLERARAEAALSASELRQATILETMAEGVVTLDLKNRFVSVNAAAERILGVPRAELIGRSAGDPPFRRLSLDGAPKLDQPTLSEIQTSGDRIFHDEYIIERPDGSQVVISRNITALRDKEGVCVGFVSTITDVSERKRTEAALRENEARFRTLSNAVPQLIWTNTADGTATYFNQRWYEYSGLSYEESLGLGWQAMVHPHDAAASVGRWQHALLAGEVFNSEYRLRRADGMYRWHLGRNVPLHDDQGRISGWFGSATDIENLKQAEAILQHANEELEARVEQRTAELLHLSTTRQELLQRLVTAQEDEQRRIAHELHDSLGQFLSALTLDLARVQSIAGTPLDVRTDLARLQRVANEIDAELDRLTMELRPLTLDDLGLDEALDSYAHEWSTTSGIPIEIVAKGFRSSRLPLAVEATVYRIVQETLTNIRKHAHAQYVSIILERKTELLRVIIEDDGVGFDPDAVVRERSGGRQLGLVGMRERASLAGGTLSIESAPGSGTTVYLRIPLAGERQEDGDG